jgi:pimeloyl-ACP methyl ester carboxylesterase
MQQQNSTLTFAYKDQHSVSYNKVGEGKPLLILHGWGSSAQVMMPIAKALAPFRSCYVLDLPGFGKSPEPPKAWAIADYLALVIQFTKQVIGQEKVDLIAHSFGGRITLKWLADTENAPLLDKVLITGGAGLKPKRSLQFYAKKYLAKVLKTPLTWLPEPLQSKALKALRNTQLWQRLGSSDYRQLSGVMRETFVKTVSEFLDPLLPKIQQEVFLLWGETDAATPLDQAHRLEKGMKNATLVKIANAGHYAFIDQTAQFNAITKAYLVGTD